MKKGLKKLFGLVLVFGLLAALLPDTVVFAANGPSKEKTDNAFICVVDAKKETETYIFAVDSETNKLGKVKGVTYSQKTNTLTLKNYKGQENRIIVNAMGDDFKIKVTGNNTLGNLTAWGYGYGGSISITGTGSVTINKSTFYDYAIIMLAEKSQAVLAVDKKVTLKAYAGKETKASVLIKETAVSSAKKAVIFKNKASISKVKQEVVPLYQTSQQLLYTEYTDADPDLSMKMAFTLSKEGEVGQAVAMLDQDGWNLYMLMDEQIEGNPVYRWTSLIEDIDNFEYSLVPAGEAYDYTYSGNLSLKKKK